MPYCISIQCNTASHTAHQYQHRTSVLTGISCDVFFTIFTKIATLYHSCNVCVTTMNKFSTRAPWCIAGACIAASQWYILWWRKALLHVNDASNCTPAMAWGQSWRDTHISRVCHSLGPKVDGVGGFSKVVATFNHVDGSFNIFMVTTRGVWIIPSFLIWGYVLYVEHISYVITNCGQHQWAIPSLFSIALSLLEENVNRKLLSLSLDLFKILLFQVSFLIFFSIAVIPPYFIHVDLLLQYVALFQSRELLKV